MTHNLTFLTATLVSCIALSARTWTENDDAGNLPVTAHVRVGITDSTGSALATQANYPLLTDLLDASGNYGPVELKGNPIPPDPPSNGVCVNGIYFLAAAGGQDVTTPNISMLDTTDFQVEVEFKLSALPPRGISGPVIMGGTSFRFIGIYLQDDGTAGVRYNNSSTTWSSTPLIAGVWYSATLKFETDTAQLLINGDLVHQDTIGALTAGGALNFTTNDFATGTSLNGCVRNLVISNDTTLSAGSPSAYTTYGSGCVGSVGTPALDNVTGSMPTLGNPFVLRMSNLPPGSATAFLAFGFSRESWAGIPLPADLGTVGIWGCTLYVSVDVAFPLTPMGSTLDFSFDIPNDPSIVGLQFFNQGLVFDAGVNPFLGGAVVTNAGMGIVRGI